MPRDAKHKAQVLARQNQYRKLTRAWKLEYLKTHPCVDCGESHVATLDFDHVRGIKSAGISTLIRRGQTLKRVLEEVAKCEVRCSNCHRKRTFAVNGWLT